MADSNYPAVGLKVDYDDFSDLDRAVDRGIASYARLRKAAVDSTKVDSREVEQNAERKVRAVDSATKAQLASTRQIMAAQRGLTNYMAQQDAQVFRTRQNLARQQANEVDKLAKGEAAAAVRAAREGMAADRQRLMEFRRMMDQRVAAGRTAATAEQREAEQTLALRRRLNAQQAAEARRLASEEIAAAQKVERDAVAAAERVAREREKSQAYITRMKVRYFAQEQAAQERADRAAASASEKAARDQVAADQRAAKERERSLQYVHNLKLRYFREEQAAQERASRDAAASAARAARDQANYLSNAARTRARGGESVAAPEVSNLSRALEAGKGAVNRFGQATDGLRNGLHRLRVAFFDLRTLVALFLGGLIVGPLVRFADQMTALEARVGFFANSAKDVPYTFQAIYDTAQRARAPLEAVGTLYTRLAPLAAQLGKSQLELLRVTETVQKGIAVGGASPQEAAASSQQLAQALASNRLGGDELRSLAENAPILLGQIAKSLNMNTGEFIKWAHEGKANAAIVIGALEEAAPRIDALFAQFPVTVSQGVTVVSNAFQKLVGEVNSATKVGESIGKAFVEFSNFLGSAETIAAVSQAVVLLGHAFGALGTALSVLVDSLPVLGAALVVIAVRAALASRAVTGMGVAFAATSALVGRSAAIQIVAVNALSVAMGRLAVAGRSAMAFFGGPLGVAIIAAAAAFSYFSANALTAEQSLNKFNSANENAASAVERAIAFNEAYGGSTENLTEMLLDLNGVQEDQVRGLDDAGKAAYARAVNERNLTASLLERAAAESIAAAASLRRGAMMTKVSRISQELDPYLAGARLAAKATGVKTQRVLDAEAEIARLKGLEGLQSSLADKLDTQAPRLMNLAEETRNMKPTIATPEAANGGVAQASADKVDKAAQRRAESLARELRAMEATAAGNIALAKAYDISGAAALRQEAAVEATGRAIKRQGDIDAFVQAQMNVNAAEAAATAAKEVYGLNQRVTAQRAANAAVQSGSMSAASAAAQMEINLELSEMQAQADAASGAAQEILIRKIQEKRRALEDLNEAEREARLIDDRSDQRDAIALMDKEIELLGASNRERAVQLAMLAKRQELTRDGTINSAGAEAAIQGAGDVAGKGVDVQQKTEAYNDSLREQVDILGQIDSQARQAGQGLADAFGQGGAALADLLGVMTGYQAKQAEIAADRKAYTDSGQNDAERLAMFDREATYATIKNYGDMAGAAKNLFSERSRGYKLLEGAEKAFRIFEFAMSAKSIAIKATETAAKIGLFGAQAQAAATAGAANMFATLGPAGFAAVAAMVAVLGGMGLMLAGGGGGSIPGANDATNRQASQGGGSVLGDAQAKSESLAKAMTIVAANSNKDLEFSNGMLKSLRAIESGIGRVAAALGRTLAAGGSLSTDGLNLGKVGSGGATSGQTALFSVVGGVVGFALTKILPGLFGSKTTRTLQDQGLEFGSQSLGGILSGGIDGQTYQQVLEQTKKKAFGITYSNKASSSTTTSALDADFTQQVSLLIGSLRGAVLEGAKILGLDGAEAVLDAFQVNLGKLSFKDMSGEEIQAALNSIFSKLGDDLATTAIPGLANLQKAGEGAFETLARVTRNYVVLDTSLKSIGMTFGAVGIASLEARENLIDLAGGIDALVEQTAYFSENFLTDLERMAPIQRAVTEELARLGLQGVQTKDQFKDLVLGLDLSTQSGAEMYAALMALAPAFAKLVDFTASGSAAVQSASSELSKAYEREAAAMNSTIDKLKKLAEALGAFDETLSVGPLSGASSADIYARTRGNLLNASTSTDPDVLAEIPSLGQAFLEASKQNSATLVDYQRDVAMTRNIARAAQATALDQVTVAEQQLAALTAQVSALISINESVIGVQQAILNLQAALAQQAAVIKPPPTSTPTPGDTGAGGGGTTPPPQTSNMVADYAAYVAQNGDVAAEYARNLASSKGRALLDQLNIQDSAGFGQYHYETYGRGEGRNLPQMSVPLVRTAAEASALSGSNDNSAVSAQLGDLYDLTDDLKRGIEAVALNTGKMARINSRWDGDGMPETREVAV